MLSRMGISTGIDLSRAIDTARWVEQHVGHPVPGMLGKAGEFPGARRATV
jgi:isopropylmalate/homocitrate/citramalate synthase